MSSPTSSSGVSQPLLVAQVGSYGSTGTPHPQGQNPLVVDPAVLARTMQVLATQMAAKQTPQPPAPSIAQASAQQTLALKDGQYVGDVQDGLPHGRGTLTYHPGMVRKKYEGEWKEGQFHGRGVLRFSNEDRYEGQWENGQLHGQGIQFFANGGKYAGAFVKGKSHGKGTMKYSNGDTYDGSWQNDQRHGLGTYKETDGSTYDGQWLNNKKHGPGNYRWGDGHYYFGHWENGLRHGSGTESTAIGTRKGTFRNGQQWTGTWESWDPKWVGMKRGTYEDGVQKTDCCSSCSIL